MVEPLLLAGRIATCGIVDLELLYSARNPSPYVRLSRALEGMPRVPITETVMDEALAIQAELAKTSRHRSVPIPDLVVAACAVVHGLTVLHYDAGFDVVAEITGQACRWVVPRGSVD